MPATYRHDVLFAMPTNARLLVALLAVCALHRAVAQKMQTPAGEAPGPWLLGTIGVGKQADGTMKPRR